MRSLGERLNAIYVDDDEDDKLLFKESMADAGFVGPFDLLNSAEELFEYLNRHKASLPDIVFLDIHLPKMDGLEAFEKIRSDPTLRGILVVLVTGSKSYLDFLNSVKGGAASNGILCKPLKNEKLLKVLKPYGIPAA